MDGEKISIARDVMGLWGAAGKGAVVFVVVWVAGLTGWSTWQALTSDPASSNKTHHSSPRALIDHHLPSHSSKPAEKQQCILRDILMRHHPRHLGRQPSDFPNQHVREWLHQLSLPASSPGSRSPGAGFPTPPPSIGYTRASVKRQMEEDNGRAEEVTPRPTKKRRNRVGGGGLMIDAGPSQSPGIRRRLSLAGSQTHSQSSVSTSSTSRNRNIVSDVAQHLEVANPAIHVGFPPAISIATLPPQVVRLHSLLEDIQYLTHFVPNIPPLINGLRAAHMHIPNSCLITVDHGQDGDKSAVLAAHFAATGLEIANNAQTAFNRQYNESNWYPIIRAVLSWPSPPPSAYLHAPPTALPPQLTDIIEARDISVSHEYLPTSADDPTTIISGVKVDHLILLNNAHPSITAAREQVLREDFSTCFSPFVDRWVAKSFVVALVEVKAPGGDRSESQVRLAAPAVLEAVKRVGDARGSGRGKCKSWLDEAPVVCFVVNGHNWEARLGYWDSEESVRILGPIAAGNTTSFVNTCRLLKMMEVLKAWAEDFYLPFIVSKLQRIIEGESEEVAEGQGPV